MNKQKIAKFIGNWFIRASVWTFFLHIAAAGIYYTHFELYKNAGVQVDAFSSVALVIFMVAGGFFVSRPVLARVLIR
jgi:hypothetical protein